MDKVILSGRMWLAIMVAVWLGLGDGSVWAQCFCNCNGPEPAVTDLTATAISPYQIHLQWSYPGNGVRQYRILRSPNGVDTWSAAGENFQSSSILMFEDTAVTPGQSYFYKVEHGILGTGVCGDCCMSPRSAAATVILPAAPVFDAGIGISNILGHVDGIPFVGIGTPVSFTTAGQEEGQTGEVNCVWDFGNGTGSNGFATVGTYNVCGRFAATASLSDGVTTTSNSASVIVACALETAQLSARLRFAETNADAITLSQTFELPADFAFSNQTATLEICTAVIVVSWKSWTTPSK